jgi:hypothetical protein
MIQNGRLIETTSEIAKPGNIDIKLFARRADSFPPDNVVGRKENCLCESVWVRGQLKKCKKYWK